MPSRLATDFNNNAFGSSIEPFNRASSFRGLNATSILFAAGHPGDRSVSTYSKNEDLRQFSILADFFEPLLGAEESISAARTLITQFGSIGRVLSADPAAISRSFNGHRTIAGFIARARILIETGQLEEFSGQPVCIEDDKFLKFMVRQFSGLNRERLVAFFFDDRGLFLGELIVDGEKSDTVAIAFRTIFNRAFDLGANRMVLAHNHPSGNEMASERDIQATKKLIDLGHSVDLTLLDHLIVSDTRIFSMKRANLI